MIRNIVENGIITFGTLSEILFGVIDDVICPERLHQIEIPRAANAGHIRDKRLRDLHCECSYASRRAVDQDLLPLLDFSFVANSLQSGDAGYVYRSCLFKGHICRFQRDGSVGARSDVLGKRSASSAEYFIARFELSHVLTDRLDRSGK